MALVGPPGDGGRAEGARDRRSGTPESRPQLEELRFGQVGDEALNRRAALQNLVDVTRRHLELGTGPTHMLPPQRGHAPGGVHPPSPVRGSKSCDSGKWVTKLSTVGPPSKTSSMSPGITSNSGQIPRRCSRRRGD